ncbi:MAG: hypothetical protein HC877_04965 [Thioploca sp.]|nr:hypothetical protein [Thioploca sp.]
MTHFSTFFKKNSLVHLLFLTVLLSKISFATDSSISFCEIAILTGGSCLILDKDNPDFATLFPNTVLNILLNSLQPTITAVTPLQLPQGSTADILITAPKAHFNSTSLANLNLSGGIVVNTGKAVLSPIQLIANVSVPTTTPVGFYDITAKTTLADNQTETVSGRQLLQVIPASLQPIILSVTPLVVSRNTESTRLTIYGQNTHFSNQSLLDFGDAGLTVLDTVVKSPTQLQVDLNITSTAKVGFHKVKVKTNQELAKDIQPLGLLQVFESNQPPALIYLQPAQGRQWETLSINLLGKDTHFVQGETTVNWGDGIQVVQTTVSSPTELTVVVTLTSEALLGPRDVFVTTGAETVVFTNGFAVFSPATINFTPKVGKTGETVTLTIQGDDQTQFIQGQTELRMATSKDIGQLDTGIIVKSLEVQNAHLATAVIQIANQITPGVRYLAVVTNNKEVMIPANGEVFEVISGNEARVKSLEPAAAVLGETKIVTLSGENTHFNAQSVIKWSGSGIYVNTYQVLSDNEIQLTLMIDNNAPVGTQGIQVITGTETANLANAFTLLAPEQMEIVVNKRGNHGQVMSNLAGIQCGEDCTHRYAKGTVIVLTAEPDPEARFSGWEATCRG